MGVVRKIEEELVEGKRLGRHVNHDDRSLAYRVPVTGPVTPTTVRWNREIPVLDQGNVGSCTGNATVGTLGTDPFFGDLAALRDATPPLVLDENEALAIYSDAEKIDGGQGYPPEDQGSSGLSVAKAAQARGLISGYQHVTSIDEAHVAIQSGPTIIGADWYQGFDSPDANGVVTISGNVRGGHEFSCIGYDADADLWECVNSWGSSWGKDGHFFFSTETLTHLLASDGDMTSFVPVSQPAPVPTPPNPEPGPSPEPTPTPDPEGRHHWDPFAPIEEVVDQVEDFVEAHLHHAPPQADPEEVEAEVVDEEPSEETHGDGDETQESSGDPQEPAGDDETGGDDVEVLEPESEPSESAPPAEETEAPVAPEAAPAPEAETGGQTG